MEAAEFQKNIDSCEHEPDVIYAFQHDYGEGMVVWCKKCGSYCIHDEYTHDEPEKWQWNSPSGF